MAAAACSRSNLQRAFITKKEASRLAEVERAVLAAAAGAAGQQQPAPSVLRGCIVRLKYAGTYCLLPVEGITAATDGRPGLEVLFPDAQQRDKLLRVPLTSASSTNPFDDANWESAGRAEVERLAALLQQRGQPLTVAEVAAAAWRKQAALEWHAQHGAQPLAEQQQHLPALLQQLADEQAIAALEQEIEPDEQPQQQPQQLQQTVGFTVHLPGPALAANAAADVQLPTPGQQQQVAQPLMQQQQHAAGGAAALEAVPPGDTAGHPAAAGAAAEFLAGLERQLADATNRSAADGGSAAMPAVVADIQQQLAALKQQILAVQQQQQQQPMAAAQPAWHASSSSGGDHLSPYLGPAMHGAHVQRSLPLHARQAQQLEGLRPFGPGRQPLPDAASLGQGGWHGESTSPPRHLYDTGSLGGHFGRPPSPLRQQWQSQRDEPPLFPVAVCHFKFGCTVKWELIGRQIFVSGLPTCDGYRVQRRVVANRLATLIEGTGAAVTEVSISNGDERGDLAYVTLGSARQAAHAIEQLQGTELMDARRIFMRPFRTEVEALQRQFPAVAAETTRALEGLAARGPPWGAGPPPTLRRRSPAPAMRGGISPPPYRGSPPPPHMRRRSCSPPPPHMRRRSRSPPAHRGSSPPPPGLERGRSGSRSPRRSSRGGRRAARSASPDAILAPVLVDHSLQHGGGQQDWMLTGREVFVGGLRGSGDEEAMWQQLMPLVAAAGGTVTDRRLSGGGPQGHLVYITLATAQQAAAVIECLQGVELDSGQLFLRPVQQDVDAKCRQHPEAAAAARRALTAAGRGEPGEPRRAGSPGGSMPGSFRSGSPGGSRRGREWDEPPPSRRGSPGPAGQYGSKGGGRRAAKHGDGSGGSTFWDPAHRLEQQCLSLLQRKGPMSLSMLFGELGAVPPPCGPLNTAVLRRFVDGRPHLFHILRDQVEAAEHAGTVLRYKRDLLQYLADRPPHARVSPEQLEAEMPLPPGLPRRLASEGVLHFVREVLWREAAIVSMPGDRSAVAVELRPYPREREDVLVARDAGHEPPAFHMPCRFFFQLNGTRASCSFGLRCRFVHAPEREDFI